MKNQQESIEEFLQDLNHPVTQSNTQLSPFNQKTLLNLTKSDINEVAQTIVQSVADGNDDALEVMVAVKKAEAFFKTIGDNVKDMFYRGNYASKGEIVSKFSCEIEKADLTSYNYDNCNDSALEYHKAQVKARQLFLKTITKPTECIDPETGEVYIANPAVKLTTSGYKISIK